jgi:hypothetical protein
MEDAMWTNGSAASGATPKRDKTKGATGGMLAQIGSRGLRVLKDFTTILFKQPEGQASSPFEPRRGQVSQRRLQTLARSLAHEAIRHTRRTSDLTCRTILGIGVPASPPQILAYC